MYKCTQYYHTNLPPNAQRRKGLSPCDSFMDASREWRIGATANRIISLAEANGTRFRLLVKNGEVN